MGIAMFQVSHVTPGTSPLRRDFGGDFAEKFEIGEGDERREEKEKERRKKKGKRRRKKC